MKVKNVMFEFELEGKGIVNYDSNEQKYIWNNESKSGGKNNLTSIYNNTSYAKKNFYRDSSGNLTYKIKISSDAIRNAIFKSDAIATNPSIQHHSALLNTFMASVQGLLRGYMFAGDITYKRKSPLSISCAEQINNSVSHLEKYSRSGEKKKNDDSDKGDTTFFERETIGDITYSGEGFINIQGLEFISCDPIFDRMEFNADHYNLLSKALSRTLPNYDSQLNYYTLKTSSIDVAEYGIKIGNENIVFLVREALRRILNINIQRATAFSKISRLRVKLITDALNADNDQWIEIKSNSDIDNINFEPYEFYVLADSSTAKEQRIAIEDEIKKLAEEKKRIAEEKKRIVAAKNKEKKNKEKNESVESEIQLS